MKLDRSTSILIVGLGLLGGSYARALTKKGYRVDALTLDRESIDYALAEGIIAKDLAPILSETNALTMLGVDALTNTALVHIPNPTARFGSFFLLAPTK